jgi:hypothetical protein
MDLFNWAKKWNISESALWDFMRQIGVTETQSQLTIPMSEAAVLNLVRLEAMQKGARLWRNNVGAIYDGTNYMRYGLANDSPGLNKIIKSADLIGIKPVIITHGMVGGTIGQFISREVKPPSWQYRGTEREKAQLAWINLVLSLGGNACFATGEGTL